VPAGFPCPGPSRGTALRLPRPRVLVLRAPQVYGEAIATLAGSALLADAFLHIHEATPPAVPPRRAARAAAELATAAGSRGLQQGQAVDMLCEGPDAPAVGLDGLQYIHRHKTGAMVRPRLELLLRALLC
jgi:geranylgeranyl pyrophosphate synthase